MPFIESNILRGLSRMKMERGKDARRHTASSLKIPGYTFRNWKVSKTV